MLRPAKPVLPLLITLILLLLPAPAAAHTALLRSSPSPGENLPKAPLQVEVQFSRPVSAPFAPLTVRDSKGRQVDLGDARIAPDDRSRARVSLKPLPDGPYTVRYRVTSLDGHLVEGTISFTVGQPGGAAEGNAPGAIAQSPEPGPTTVAPKVPAPPEPPARAQVGAPEPPPAPGAGTTGSLAAENAVAARVQAAISLAHGVAQGSAALLAGLPLFLMLVWLPVSQVGSGRSGYWAALFTLLLIGAGFLEISLYATQASGEAWSPAVFSRVLTQTQVGRIWLVRAAAALLAALALARIAPGAGGRLRGVLALPGLLLLLTFSLQSHAMATGRPLPVLADWLHLLAIAPWVGGLAGFALVVWPQLSALPSPERDRLLTGAVPRFSRLATFSVLLLLLTGLYSALLHIPDWAALWTTAYGHSLLWKLLLLIPVLLLGAYNLFGGGHGPFRLAVGAELALVLAIFLAAGFLTNLPTADVETAARISSGPGNR